MNVITRYFHRIRERHAQAFNSRLKDAASDMYQIQEWDGELWFTLGAELVCPVYMFKDDAIDALRKMRKAYFERNMKQV